MRRTEVYGTLQRIEISIGVGMADFQFIIKACRHRCGLGLESPCTAVYSAEVRLLHGRPVYCHIISGIILQALLMRFDNEIVAFHSYRIIVYDTAADGRTRRRDTDNIHPCIQCGHTVFNRLPAV